MPDQTAAAPKYRYFIGWASAGRAGGTDLIRTRRIRRIADVADAQETLRRHYKDPELTVISFSRYDD